MISRLELSKLKWLDFEQSKLKCPGFEQSKLKCLKSWIVLSWIVWRWRILMGIWVFNLKCQDLNCIRWNVLSWIVLSWIDWRLSENPKMASARSRTTERSSFVWRRRRRRRSVESLFFEDFPDSESRGRGRSRGRGPILFHGFLRGQLGWKPDRVRLVLQFLKIKLKKEINFSFTTYKFSCIWFKDPSKICQQFFIYNVIVSLLLFVIVFVILTWPTMILTWFYWASEVCNKHYLLWFCNCYFFVIVFVNLIWPDLCGKMMSTLFYWASELWSKRCCYCFVIVILKFLLFCYCFLTWSLWYDDVDIVLLSEWAP